ncbi:MAG: hypothetical protein EBZ47_09500 [Chlamydiae bacterium]|nr:hypothetical protein [Chlamydiota bacterium]
MKKTGSIVLIYGLLVFIGGWIGYITSHSPPSAISGTLFGALLFLAGRAMIVKKTWGQWTALFLAFILDAFFTYRFAKTLKFFPAGFMSLLSLAVLIILALRIQMYKKIRK